MSFDPSAESFATKASESVVFVVLAHDGGLTIVVGGAWWHPREGKP